MEQIPVVAPDRVRIQVNSGMIPLWAHTLHVVALVKRTDGTCVLRVFQPAGAGQNVS